jgi:hypothetical protein
MLVSPLNDFLSVFLSFFHVSTSSTLLADFTRFLSLPYKAADKEFESHSVYVTNAVNRQTASECTCFHLYEAQSLMDDVNHHMTSTHTHTYTCACVCIYLSTRDFCWNINELFPLVVQIT